MNKAVFGCLQFSLYAHKPLPLFAVRAADTDAPFFLAISLASFGLWLITKLGIRFPRQSIIQNSEDIIDGGIPYAVRKLLFAHYSISKLFRLRDHSMIRS